MQYILRIVAAVTWLLTLLCGAVSGGNFVGVAANTPPEFIEAAEQARIKSAEYWTGQRLPDWPEPVPIYWTETTDRTGGHATYRTAGDRVTGISRVSLTGPRGSVLRDVIPHEVDHLVRVTIVGKKIPRVLDEGAACLFERGDDPAEYVASLVRKADTVTLWNDIDTKTYPEVDDIAPFYGFSVSLTEFLLERHGKTKLLSLMQGTPSARWEIVLGESLDETQAAWSTHFRGQIRKPVIRMFSLPWCGPCREFWGDYLSRSHTLPYVVVKEPPPLIGGPQGVPAFVAPDGARAIGYGRGWQNWDAWARSHIPANWQPTQSRDAGLPAVAESVPSTQGRMQDASQQPTASDIQPRQRDGPAVTGTQSDLPQTTENELKGAPERTVTPADPSHSDQSESAGTGELAGGVDQPPVDRLEAVGDKAESFFSNPVVQGGLWAAVGLATGGTGLAAKPYVGAAWTAIRLLRRRRKEKKNGRPTEPPAEPTVSQGGDGEPPSGFPDAELRLHDRDTTEAAEHLRLGQLEGRNALLDAFMGMSFDDAITRDLDNPDMPAELQTYARALRDEVRQRTDAAAPVSTGKPYSDSWRRGTTHASR